MDNSNFCEKCGNLISNGNNNFCEKCNYETKQVNTLLENKIKKIELLSSMAFIIGISNMLLYWLTPLLPIGTTIFSFILLMKSKCGIRKKYKVFIIIGIILGVVYTVQSCFILPTVENYSDNIINSPYANNPYASNPYANNPYANNPYANNPYANNPYVK